MFNPEYENFKAAIEEYTNASCDADFARACLLGKLMAVIDFSLNETQLKMLTESIRNEADAIRTHKEAA